MKNIHSAGGIVVNSKKQILLIQNKTLRNTDRFYWGFPKGMIDPGETAEVAAVREVREEGGINAEIIQKIGDNSYFFTHKDEKYSKKVTIFLMEYISGNISDHDDEVMDIGWFDVKDALEKLSFKGDKELLEKAVIFLHK